MRQAVSSETIDYNKPLFQRVPELFSRDMLHSHPYDPANHKRRGEGDWDADVLMRYHGSKDGEYRSVGAPQTSTNAAMRTLPKGTSDALRAELAKLTAQDGTADVSTVSMAQSLFTKVEPLKPFEAGWRSSTLVGEGAQETPEQAHFAALQQVTEGMYGPTVRAAEIMTSRSHALGASMREETFRTAERRLQLSVDTVTKQAQQ